MKKKQKPGRGTRPARPPKNAKSEAVVPEVVQPPSALTVRMNEIAFPSGVESLADKIRSRDDLHTVIFSETTYGDMLNMPLVFVFIVLLLAIEWIVRKYNGKI